MKQLTIILSCLLTAMLLGSCKKEFLEEKPKDATYAENLYTNYDGFRLAVNALLDFPRQERADMVQSAEIGGLWKIGVDNGWANAELSWTRGFSKYSVDLNSEAQFLNRGTDGRDGIFLILYRAINSANMIIGRAANPDVDWQGSTPAESEAKKNLILGHAYLIRAWAYRHLVFSFGPVPISTEEINGSTFRNDWERNSIAEVQDLIISDLRLAEQYLPDNSLNVLELSRAVAQHYLAEIYLWKGENAKAEEEALKVANNPNYKLITARYGVKSSLPGNPFMDQFLDGNILPREGNTEALWVFQNSDVIDYLGARANSMRRSWVVNYSSFAPYTPENGGRGIGRYSITSWGLSIYEPQDDRFSEFAIKKSYVSTSGVVTFTQSDPANMKINNNRWASTRKWDWTYADPSLWNATHSFAPQTYLRLADTYLLLAEALMKQGRTTEAAEWINKVRRRSHASEINAQQVTLDFILDERSRELVTEELRRETLVRTNKLVERTRAHNPLAVNIQEHHVLFPIPQYVIDANTERPMAQNPGY